MYITVQPIMSQRGLLGSYPPEVEEGWCHTLSLREEVHLWTRRRASAQTLHQKPEKSINLTELHEGLHVSLLVQVWIHMSESAQRRKMHESSVWVQKHVGGAARELPCWKPDLFLYASQKMNKDEKDSNLLCLTSISVLGLNLSVVIVQRFQVFVAVHGGAGQPHVHGSKKTDISDRRDTKRLWKKSEKKLERIFLVSGHFHLLPYLQGFEKDTLQHKIFH